MIIFWKPELTPRIEHIHIINTAAAVHDDGVLYIYIYYDVIEY